MCEMELTTFNIFPISLLSMIQNNVVPKEKEHCMYSERETKHLFCSDTQVQVLTYVVKEINKGTF